jgi:hypothetical protein
MRLYPMAELITRSFANWLAVAAGNACECDLGEALRMVIFVLQAPARLGLPKLVLDAQDRY